MKQETLKKIVELADGFEIRKDDNHEYIRIPNKAGISFEYLEKEKTIYPLLIRRAVEGWNDIHAESSNYKNDINISPNVVLRYEKNVLEKVYRHAEYKKTEYLTPQEQAIEACLIELLEEAP